MIDLPTEALWLVIALPLGGSLLLHFVGRWLGEPLAGYLACAASLAAFGVAAVAAVPFFTGEGHPSQSLLWEWMPAVGASFEIVWDPLSALMTLVVTGVGSLIHVYSLGYMHGDPRFPRFFAYLNLFTASMLTLVLAGNFAILFVGCIMARALRNVPWDDLTECVPAIVTALAMPFTYSIATGIGMGFIAYALIKLFSGRASDLNAAVVIVAVLFGIRFAIT